jgi:hypothetical protein
MKPTLDTVLDGALASGKAFLIFGRGTPEEKVLGALGQRLGNVDPLNLRGIRPDALKQLAKSRLSNDSRGVLVVLTDEAVSAPVHELLSELVGGAKVQLIALHPKDPPDASLADLFTLRLASGRALDARARTGHSWP